MAELKSTLELVMERTKNMVETPEERARKKAEELEARARGISLRLCDELIRPEELLRAIEDASDQDPEELRGVLLAVMIDELDLTRPCDDLLEGFKILAGPASSEALARASELTLDFEEATGGLIQEAKEKALAELAAQGISGSAVRPKFEASPWYRTAAEDVARNFADRLTRLKADLRGLI